MCFQKFDPPLQSRPASACIDAEEAEATFYEAQATYGYASAEALVARWYWHRVRNRNRAI